MQRQVKRGTYVRMYMYACTCTFYHIMVILHVILNSYIRTCNINKTHFISCMYIHLHMRPKELRVQTRNQEH